MAGRFVMSVTIRDAAERHVDDHELLGLFLLQGSPFWPSHAVRGEELFSATENTAIAGMPAQRMKPRVYGRKLPWHLMCLTHPGESIAGRTQAG